MVQAAGIAVDRPRSVKHAWRSRWKSCGASSTAIGAPTPAGRSPSSSTPASVPRRDQRVDRRRGKYAPSNAEISLSFRDDVGPRKVRDDDPAPPLLAAQDGTEAVLGGAELRIVTTLGKRWAVEGEEKGGTGWSSIHRRRIARGSEGRASLLSSLPARRLFGHLVGC